MPALAPTLVYLLCFATSLICALLLGRSYARTRSRMLLWSAICFGFLALANLVKLWPIRLWLSLAAISILLFGFIWDQDD